MDKPRIKASIPFALQSDDSPLGKQMAHVIRCREDGVDGWESMSLDIHGHILAQCSDFKPDFIADASGFRCISGAPGYPIFRGTACADCIVSLVGRDEQDQLVYLGSPTVESRLVRAIFAPPKSLYRTTKDRYRPK